MEENLAWAIHRATPADEPEVRRLLAQYKIVHNSNRRYDWLYHRNPQGPSATWLAVLESGSREVVGFTSIFSRDFQIDGQSVSGGVGFDAFVKPEHRRRGIAAALHRASYEDMRRGAVPYRFMCGPPASANLGALLKAGSHIVGDVGVYIRPLTARGLVDSCHLDPRVQAPLRRVASAVDRGRSWVPAWPDVRPTVRVRSLDLADPDIDGLWASARRRHAVIGRRDSSFLRWRFEDNPVCRQDVVGLQGLDGLVGWAALEFAAHGCLIVDCLLPQGPRLTHAALQALALHAARRGAHRIAIRANAAGSLRWSLLAAGYLRGRSREQLQVLCPDPTILPALLKSAGWFFGSGDLNPEATHWSVVTSPAEPWSNADYLIARPRVSISSPRKLALVGA